MSVMLPTTLFISRAFGLDKLATAEGEQLPRQSGGAFSGLHDLMSGTRRRVI